MDLLNLISFVINRQKSNADWLLSFGSLCYHADHTCDILWYFYSWKEYIQKWTSAWCWTMDHANPD